jgi:hypothetical protein
VHLTRQDARLNALAAMVRCVCWFNPLIHLGATWLRTDQELACDAAALQQNISRRAYAQALLKSQMVQAEVPLGCMWPGTEHPLTERIALLGRGQLPLWRRIAGLAALLAAVSVMGVGAWAAQPQSAPSGIGAGYPSDMLTYTNRDPKDGHVLYFTLKADRHQDFKNAPSRLTGNVAMQFPYGMARADKGSVNDTGTIILTDNVRLMYGGKIQTGETLTFEARSGMLMLDGKKMPSGMPAQK